MASKSKIGGHRRSTVEEDVLHGLRELVGTIKAGKRIEDHFKVRIV